MRHEAVNLGLRYPSELIMLLWEKYEGGVKMKKIEIDEMMYDFEYGEVTRYCIVRAGDRYAVVWSAWEWPTEDGEVPAEDIPGGESGIEWHDTMAAAVGAMKEILESMAIIAPDWAAEALENLK